MTLYEFSRGLADLKKTKQFSGALQYFKENKKNFESEQIAANDFIISDMMMILRKTGHSKSVFQFLDYYHIAIDDSTSERVLSAYGWALYDAYKQENEQPGHFNAHAFMDRVSVLIPLLGRSNSEYSYSVVSRLLGIVLKTEKKKASVNWNFIDTFCNLFDPSVLHTECDSIEVSRKGRMTTMELASDRESWYAAKSKALMELGRMQECFEVSKEALHDLPKFHYSNELWFARRIALAKKSSGNIRETISELESILKRKKEWFIQRELSELYLEEGDTDKAFAYAMQAINNFGDLEYKVGLLELIGDILTQKNEKEMAYKHLLLSQLIRERNEWKIPPSLSEKIVSTGVKTSEDTGYDALLAELKKYWKTFREKRVKVQQSAVKEKHKGKVKVILNDNEKGKNGFIASDEQDYYFVLSNSFALISKITIGTGVEFEVITSTDAGKRDRAKITGLSA